MAPLLKILELGGGGNEAGPVTIEGDKKIKEARREYFEELKQRIGRYNFGLSKKSYSPLKRRTLPGVFV